MLKAKGSVGIRVDAGYVYSWYCISGSAHLWPHVREMPEPLYEWLEEETGLRSKLRLSSVASIDSD